MKNSFAFFLLCAFLLSSPLAYAIDFAESVAESDQNSVLALGDLNAGNGQIEIFCSAVAIQSKIVLTAAHCLQEGAKRQGHKDLKILANSLRVFVGQKFARGAFKEDPTLADSIYKVKNAFIHPDYGRSFRGQFDIAVLVLEKDLGLKAHEYPQVTVDAIDLRNTLRKGALLRVSGFGWSKTKSIIEPKNRQDFGVKKTALLPVDGVTGTEVFLGPGPASSRGSLLQARPREGDSGGPLFAATNGQKSLIGLVSRSAVIRSDLPIAAFTLIRPSICWIQQVTKADLIPAGNINFCADDFRRGAPSDLKASDTFMSLCESKTKLHIQDQHTLQVLFKLHQTSDCESLKTLLQRRLSLNLDRTGIKSLNLLNFFPHIERLSVRDNELERLHLTGFPNLRFLDVSYNNVRTWPKNFGHSELWLVGQERQFHSLGRTQFIKLCQSSTATSQQKKTVRALLDQLQLSEKDCINANYELARSRSLKIKPGQWLEDLSPLQGLVALESLDVSEQNLISLDFLNGLPALTQLKVDGNSIQDWSGLKNLKNLKNLSVRNTGLTHLNFLDDTPRLQILDISYNRIESFDKAEAREKRGLLRVIGKELQSPLD